MKKKIMSLVLAFAMLTMTLTACGSSGSAGTDSQAGAESAGNDNNGEAADASSEDVQVVTVWSDNAHEQTVREAQIEEFNNTIGKEEGIRIDYTVYGSDYADVVNVALMANDGPDLFRPSSNTFAKYVSAGYAVPISDLDGSDALLSKYNKDDLIVGDQVFDDKVYTGSRSSIPCSAD